jgi:hypothetical protein
VNYLRDIARNDRVIGAITDDECILIATVLDYVYRHWWLRILLPKSIRDKALSLRMIAAALGRTPAERQPRDIKIQIYQEMQKAHGK